MTHLSDAPAETPKPHAIWGGSGCAGLIACPGRYGLTRDVATSGSLAGMGTSSVYADEGTVAHYIAEQVLEGNQTAVTLTDAIAWGRTTQMASGRSIPWTEEMRDGAILFDSEVAVPAMMRARPGPGDMFTEVQVSLDGLFPKGAPFPMTGWADLVVLGPDYMMVADYKFGVGNLVEIVDNAALRFYALGAFLSLPMASSPPVSSPLTPSSTIEMVICQPRAFHPSGMIRREVITLADLLFWGEDVLKPAVKRALEPNAPFVTGDHCRFCPVLTVCPKAKAEIDDAARAAFSKDDGPVEGDDPVVKDLGNDTLAAMLDMLPLYKSWADAVEREAETRMFAGQTIPGWKVVGKKSPRRWRDEAQVRQILLGAGVPLNLWIDDKLRSPTQIKKALGKDPILDAIDPFVDASSSGPTIAPEADPRPPWEKPDLTKIFSTPGTGTP